MRAQKREQILRKEVDERRRTANLEWTIINDSLEEIEN